MTAAARNEVRIIGGAWRGRKIRFPADVPGLRPTPDRVRETVFNWLRDEVPGSRCLDLYAGSGALGLEAPAGEGTPPLPAGWSLHRSKRAGEVGYHLARAGDSGHAPAEPASF